MHIDKIDELRETNLRLNERAAKSEELEAKLKSAETEMERLRSEKDALESKSFEKDLAVFFHNHHETAESGSNFKTFD